MGFDRKAKFAFPKGRNRSPSISSLLDRRVPEKHYLSEPRRESLIDRAARSAACDKDWSFRFVENGVANALSGAPDAIYRNILVEGRRKWRTLTQREWARLMGYPDSFILPPKRGKAYQLVGGGAAIPCAVAIVERMLAALPDIGCRPTHMQSDDVAKTQELHMGSCQAKSGARVGSADASAGAGREARLR